MDSWWLINSDDNFKFSQNKEHMHNKYICLGEYSLEYNF